MKSKVQKIIILIAMIIFFTALTISPNELNASEDFNKINISDTNTVIFGIRFEPSNIDPHVTWDPNDYHSIDQVVEGLFGYNLSHPQMLLIPKLAEDFGVWTENNYTVNIKQGVTFHDGTPLDANAVKWNFDRLAYFMENYLAQARELYEYYDVSDGLLKPIINRTEVVDTHTIKFILNKVVGHFETLLSFYGSYILSPSSTSATAPIDTETGDLVGTGPFMYDNYVPNVEVNFHRNENYWAGLANITDLKFSIFNDTTTLNNALLSGDVDLIVDILPSMLDTFIADPNV
ncbi:MAG: ABC transporter substrate-binding protein, partial [Promethearchaeota archaeon]